jgi:hypothetical protein
MLKEQRYPHGDGYSVELMRRRFLCLFTPQTKFEVMFEHPARKICDVDPTSGFHNFAVDQGRGAGALSRDEQRSHKACNFHTKVPVQRASPSAKDEQRREEIAGLRANQGGWRQRSEAGSLGWWRKQGVPSSPNISIDERLSLFEPHPILLPHANRRPRSPSL